MKLPKLVPDARRLWRAYSMQAMGWGTIALAGWPMLPEEFRAAIDPVLAMRAIAFLLISGMIGRVIDQASLHPKDEPKDES